MKVRRLTVSVLCDEPDVQEVKESLVEWFEGHSVALWGEGIKEEVIEASPEVEDFFTHGMEEEGPPYDAATRTGMYDLYDG